MRSEPAESLFAPPESEPMTTTTKTARDARNTGRLFSNRTRYLAHVGFIDVLLFAATTEANENHTDVRRQHDGLHASM